MTKKLLIEPPKPLLELDFSRYTRSPNGDVPTLTALGRQLLAAVPKRMTAALTSSRDYLDGTLQIVEAAYGDHLKIPVTANSRPIDLAADTSWVCLQGRLESLARLPHDRYPTAARAGQLHDLLFPDGVSFVRLEYGAQWVEAERRLKVIEKERLKSEIDALCGPEVLAEVRRCHAEYAEMVGVTKAKEKKPKLPDLRSLRLQLQQAIGAHTMQLLAWALAGGATALEAIQPSLDAIDAYREKAQYTPSEKPESPKDPTPAPAPAP
ncbi:MAG TPA: hypothetical protein PLA87_10415 [Pseudomonadota bacterium]|jgi:hypothetical protein|nr:hypothetical protein [Deltaproteobacteria bacterium]HPH27251.1 hypothetical protein [Pseudomonadota bacterium]